MEVLDTFVYIFLENDLFRVEEAVKTDLQIVRYLDEGSDKFLEVLADFCLTCLEIELFLFSQLDFGTTSVFSRLFRLSKRSRR